MVDREIVLTYDELVAMPLIEQYVTIACVSNEVGGDLVGNALWRGVRLKELLQQAGVEPEATQIVGRAVDGFTVGFPTGYAIADDREPLVAVGMNGEPLPVDHGFPARLIVPGLFGYVSATKWLTRDRADDLGGVRRLLGAARLGEGGTDPDAVAHRRAARRGERSTPGTVPIAGVAWAPDRGVAAVEVQIDDGEWTPATISTPISDATWVQFVHRWEATRRRPSHPASAPPMATARFRPTSARRPDAGRRARAPHDRGQRRLIDRAQRRRADRRRRSRPARA